MTVNQNVVRGQQPAGQIWVIDELDAQVSTNGNITVHGKGLVLGGGNGAGGVSPNGNFQIKGTLSPTPTFPCASPLLLIQSAANSHWFALAIVRSDH